MIAFIPFKQKVLYCITKDTYVIKIVTNKIYFIMENTHFGLYIHLNEIALCIYIVIVNALDQCCLSFLNCFIVLFQEIFIRTFIHYYEEMVPEIVLSLFD